MEYLTERLRDGRDLAPEDIGAATDALVDESVSREEKAAFLEALSAKGETAAEIAAFANEFLERAVDPGLDREAVGKPLLDVCGTGGDKLNLFNVSTASVFPLAAAGIAVVKHGNRGITSRSGGADVLEALGIRIDLSPGDCCRCLDQVGAAFLFAPLYHPAFKAVGPVRKLLAERGRRTMFNLLGPLLNPVRPDYQLVGVFDAAVGPVFSDILDRLGRRRAWVVYGTTGDGAGMDELSTLGHTRIWSTDEAGTSGATIDPATLHLSPATLADLQGGDAGENARILTAILDGSLTGPKRDIVALNAAAALAVAGKAGDLHEGLALANETIDSGAALHVLHRWRQFS
ncbi:MAG: anthranilate phosphoribosyltransferase [Verrucomicrobiales bacterium]